MVTAALAGLFAISLATLSQVKPEGFLAQPKSGNGRGVLVLHPWWGLNADTKAFCQRLADEGFVAFAPDLFDGKTADTEEGALALVKGNESDNGKRVTGKVADAAKYLGELTGNRDIAVVGSSFGAYYALQLSNEAPDQVRSVVIFYGTGHEEFTRSKASYLAHFAADDDFEPKESVDALAKLLKDAGRTAEFHSYPETGHWFFEPTVKLAYNKAAAELAFSRTIEFLRRTLS